MTPGNLTGVHIPADADASMVWAVGREFDLRATRYRMHLYHESAAALALGVKRMTGAFQGVAEAASKLTRETEKSNLLYVDFSS